MTALTEYQRLETIGIWHAAPGERRRDVVVQLGEATLTISDANMSALSHWSLPAVVRLNPGALPASYGPGPDMPEVLEISDETMIGALEKLIASLGRRRVQPRRLRRTLMLAAAAALLLAGALWLPRALTAEALQVVPPARQASLGEALLAAMRGPTGGQCAEPAGRRALERLRLRLMPQGRVLVVREGLPAGQYLPGGIVLLGAPMLLAHDDPAVLAGQILALDEAARAGDPLSRLLADAGLGATLRLLTTGEMLPAHIGAHARRLLAEAPKAPPAAALAARLAREQVAAAPYAASLGAAGGALLAAMPEGAASRQLLSDQDWVALQQICAE